MPTLNSYQALAPFTLEELVEAANSVLRGRERLLVSKRTVRYYISQGVVPAPTGAPKFARYGIEHLARLVGARVLLDSGENLEAATQRLEALGRGPELLEAVGSMIERPSLLPVREARVAYSGHLMALRAPQRERERFIRIELTPDSTLEVRDTGNLPQILEISLQALKREIENS